MNVKFTFTEECLGTFSNNPDIQGDYVSSFAPDAQSKEEEVASIGVEAVIAKGKTVFPRDENGNPIMWNYQIKGFLKESARAMIRIPKSLTKDSIKTAYLKKITDLVFIFPRKIRLILPTGMTIGECQRPLRGQTAQGERVSIACSETVPAGTSYECEICCLDPGLEPWIEELITYGKYKGMLQWRNSGKGSFSYEIIK